MSHDNPRQNEFEGDGPYENNRHHCSARCRYLGCTWAEFDRAIIARSDYSNCGGCGDCPNCLDAKDTVALAKTKGESK